MKILHDITTVNTQSATSEASGYGIANGVDYTNFKQWRSTSKVQQTITLNFTGSIDLISIFGCNVPTITIAGISKTLVKDDLIGDYRGTFSTIATSSIAIVIPVQASEDAYFKMSAIVIGNKTELENVVYPFGMQLVNPTYKTTNDSGYPAKIAKGENYRLIEIKRDNLDYSDIEGLAEIKQSIKKGQTFVLFADDSDAGECYLGTRVDTFQYTETSNDFGQDSLILEETGGKPYNIRVLFELATTPIQYWSTETLKYTLSSPKSYKGRVLERGSIKDSLQDNFSQHVSLYKTSIVLDNADNNIFDLNVSEDLRGIDITRKIVDLDTETVLDTRIFTVQKPTFNKTKATLELEDQDLSLWHVRHPERTWEDSIGTLPAQSNAIGATIPDYFGYNYNVPLYYLDSDYGITHYYLYQMCTSFISSVEQVYRDGELVDSSEWTYISVTPPTVNYHNFVIFFKEQMNFANTLHNMTVDIKGMLVDGYGTTFTDNPVACFKWWLEERVGVTCNATSFTAAEAVADTLNLKIGGGVFGNVEAIDWRNEFLLACRGAKFWKGSLGYEIEIPVYQSTTDEDFNESNMVIDSYGKTNVDRFVNTVNVNYYFDLSTNKYIYQNSKDAGKSFGTTKEYNLKLINDHATASRISQYLSNKFLYNDAVLKFNTGNDGVGLREGDIIGVTHSLYNLSDSRFEIQTITGNKNIITIEAKEYSEDIFDYTAEASPDPIVSGGARSGDDVTTLIVRDGVSNQAFIDLPTSENGDVKSKVHLWYDSVNNVVKANT